MAIFNALYRATSTLKRHYPILRCMSNVPENGGAQVPNERVTLTHLKEKHNNYRKGDSKGDRITVVTAYDYPSAVHLDRAGIDVCLVGDSASMVVHGHDTTCPISFDEMLVHCRAVSRGAKKPFLVGELPFGTYESSNYQAVETAVRVLKEGGMDAIKLGEGPSSITRAKAIADAGIAVMGHVGLSPQAISVLEGFRPPGNKSVCAVKVAYEVVKSALALEKAGCFSVVLECVPPPVAAAATAVLEIPTIGIGAGPFCSGQVLVYHDLLGMFPHPHHAEVTPKLCTPNPRVGDVINKALKEYKENVRKESFPDPVHSPYKISKPEFDCLYDELPKLGLTEEARCEVAQKISDAVKKKPPLVVEC